MGPKEEGEEGGEEGEEEEEEEEEEDLAVASSSGKTVKPQVKAVKPQGKAYLCFGLLGLLLLGLADCDRGAGQRDRPARGDLPLALHGSGTADGRH